MEQLTASGQHLPAISYPVNTAGRMMEIAMLSKKIRLKLSNHHFDIFSKLTSNYLLNQHLSGLEEKMIFYLVWEVYECKIRKKMLELKPKRSIILDLPQAWAIMQMLFSIDLSAWPYEQTVAQLIISEIDHQTV